MALKCPRLCFLFRFPPLSLSVCAGALPPALSARPPLRVHFFNTSVRLDEPGGAQGDYDNLAYYELRRLRRHRSYVRKDSKSAPKKRLSATDAMDRGRARDAADAMITLDESPEVWQTRSPSRKKKQRRRLLSGGIRVWGESEVLRTVRHWEVRSQLFPPGWRISVISVWLRVCCPETGASMRLRSARRAVANYVCGTRSKFLRP